MDHFPVVQSLVRAALSGDRIAVSKQVARLRERLEKAGQAQEAATLNRLLGAVDETRDIAPSRVEVSRTLVTGERLTPDVSPPIDRETGSATLLSRFWRSWPEATVYGEERFATPLRVCCRSGATLRRSGRWASSLHAPC